MISFSDVKDQVHLINDLIISDMINFTEAEEPSDESTNFSRHLLVTKNWFSRISYANKKRFLLALLEDVRSAWALSLLLKSLWNCRPKDAVLSASQSVPWSSYDEVPMDHNRTAVPTTTLALVMKSDRVWFLSLEPEAQAMFLSELLTIASGPVMWAVLSRAQILYHRYRREQLLNLQECIVVNEPPPAGAPNTSPSVDKIKKTENTNQKSPAAGVSAASEKPVGQAQKELDANLAAWNATIKSMKDSLKLEELEMTFMDGTKRKIWKVNRPKPEVVETVDLLQLLPSSVSKRILSFLPRAQLIDCARVNKYWSFLVDEFRAEIAARQKITADFEKLNDAMLRHDTSLELVEQIDVAGAPLSSQGNFSTALSMRAKPPPSMKASEKSAGAYSRLFLNSEKLSKLPQAHIPIRNLAELSERLDRRGAADENLWRWCESILKHAKPKKDVKANQPEGVLALGPVHFPCPMMKQCLEVPLHKPLYKDPAKIPSVKPRRNISDSAVLQVPKNDSIKKYSLWTRDFSGLYPVFKIPSYQSPI